MNLIQMLRLALIIPLFMLSACMTPPEDLNLSLDRLTNSGRYRVMAHAVGAPVGINKLHSWELALRLPDGRPVEGAAIEASGGMPQHGHGFPTRPRVTSELADGRYLLEGMKFSMPGWWEIKLRISGAAGVDEITFNTVIPVTGAPLATAERVADEARTR